MSTSGSEVEIAPPGVTPERIGFWALAIIVGFIALTFAGTYYVRKGILERAMLSAIDLRDNATIWELANSVPSPINARNKDGMTPLHWAVKWGDRALVELLLAKGADVNAKTARPFLIGDVKPDYHHTPLHYAVAFGRKDLAELLIAKGADVNAKTDYGWTPLHVANSAGHIWQKEVVDLLIAKGADINAKGSNGWTPLHYAAYDAQKGAVELLIAKGADINAKDDEGKTALRLAIDGKRDAVAEVLRKAGAKE